MKSKNQILLLVILLMANFMVSPVLSHAQDYTLKIEEGICKFDGLKIGDKVSKAKRIFGEDYLENSSLGTMKSIFFPDQGILIIVEGDFVKEIDLFPLLGTNMGKIKGFNILSRNKHPWEVENMALNEAFPQDVLLRMGTDGTSYGEKKSTYNSYWGVNNTPKSNSFLSYNLINAGGEQKLMFYFDTSKGDKLVEVRNSLKK